MSSKDPSGAFIRWFDEIGIEDIPILGGKERLTEGNVSRACSEGSQGFERMRGHCRRLPLFLKKFGRGATASRDPEGTRVAEHGQPSQPREPGSRGHS